MKKEIVARLLDEKHITFDEALELMDYQHPNIYPYNPIITYPTWPDNQSPFTYTTLDLNDSITHSKLNITCSTN